MGFVINLKADTGLVDRTENTTRFYRDIKDFHAFTKEEEVKWFTILKEGTPSEKKHARDYIINCNQRLVISAARNYASTDDLTDYINEANFGLIEAVEKFDVTKGYKFATYALWFILRAINQYKYGTLQTVKKPNYYKTFHVISKAKNKFSQENEREATIEELFEMVNGTYGKNIRDKNDVAETFFESIDGHIDEDEPRAYGGTADYNNASASYNECEKNAENDFNKELVSSLIEVLDPREREIIKMRFGLYVENGVACEFKRKEIGKRLNLTSERVRQLEQSSLKKLKKEYARRISKIV